MRVTHVITRLIVGGAQENTIASVLGLRERYGWEKRLISGPTQGAEGSWNPLVNHLPGLLTLEPALVRPLHPWNDVLAYSRLTRCFRVGGPDLVHTHSGKAGVLGRSPPAAPGSRSLFTPFTDRRLVRFKAGWPTRCFVRRNNGRAA